MKRKLSAALALVIGMLIVALIAGCGATSTTETAATAETTPGRARSPEQLATH